MRRLKSVLFVSFLLLTLALVQKGDILVANASSVIFQGDLILNGNNVTTIENKRFDINGSIIVEENATLVLKNAMVNFTQTSHYEYDMTFRNPANGKPRLLCDNSAITSASSYWFQVILRQNSSATISNSMDTAYLILSNFAVASVSNSSIEFIDVHDSSVVSVLNSTVSTALQATSSPVVTVSNSAIKKLVIWSDSVNCSVANVMPGPFTLWDYQLNSSVIVSPGGYAPDVAVYNSTIDNWQLSFTGKSNVTVTDSALQSLFRYDYTVVRLVNSTASVIQYWMIGRVYVSWYIDAHVLDDVGNDVTFANLTATYSNASLADFASADGSGWGRLTLVEKMMNITGTYPVGNYTLFAKYETYESQLSVDVTGNMIITMQLPFIIPEFPSALFALALIVATLFVNIAYKRKRFRLSWQ